MGVTLGSGTDSASAQRLHVGVCRYRREQDNREDGQQVIIDCDDCAVRGAACKDCVVSVLIGAPDSLRADERAALEALADAGMAPRLRLVPIHPREDPGAA
jgi:hypothetical protein